MIATWVPHADFGDPECCGFPFGLVRGEEGFIECNDCDAVMRVVPAAELRQTLNQMEATLELASEQCPHCGNVNLFPGFSTMMAYTCRGCGEVLKLSRVLRLIGFLGRRNKEISEQCAFLLLGVVS
jgi:hypothetical protein